MTKLLDVNARTWGYHSLGQRAGVDFPYLLYADQLGLPRPHGFARGLASPGSASRPIVPTAASELPGGRLDWRATSRSLRASTRVGFSRDDPRPGFAELRCCPISP